MGARRLTLLEALLPLVALLAFFALGALFFQPTAELLIAVLLGAATVAGVSAARHGAGWAEIQRATGDRIAAVLPALLILLAIGMLIAAWIVSGTIPYMVYWGVRVVRPELLLPTAFLATAVMSLFTGTSWGSAGTIGVAFVGTAAALGGPVAATAGAVVSGAYFGDKMSPLSDTTNISAIAAGAPLFQHIRHMLWTAVPSFVLALLVYAVAAALLPRPEGTGASAAALLTDIEAAYRLHWIVLLPVVVVVWGIIRRVPPALAIVLSALAAATLGVAVHGFTPNDALVALIGGFRVDMITATDPAGLSDAFATLAERGGMFAFAPVFIVVIAAFLLAAAMDVAGALQLLVGRMLGAARGVFGLVAATMASGATMIALTSHAGVTALLVGGLYRGAYDDRGLDPVNLSRSIEDSVTITEPLMPWTVSGMFMAGALGVSTLAYAPWAVFCYGGPLFSLLIAALYRRTRIGVRPGA